MPRVCAASLLPCQVCARTQELLAPFLLQRLKSEASMANHGRWQMGDLCRARLSQHPYVRFSVKAFLHAKRPSRG